MYTLVNYNQSFILSVLLLKVSSKVRMLSVQELCFIGLPGHACHLHEWNIDPRHKNGNRKA